MEDFVTLIIVKMIHMTSALHYGLSLIRKYPFLTLNNVITYFIYHALDGSNYHIKDVKGDVDLIHDFYHLNSKMMLFLRIKVLCTQDSLLLVVDFFIISLVKHFTSS